MPYFSEICARGCKNNGGASELQCGVLVGWKQPQKLIKNQREFVWSGEAFSAAGRRSERTGASWSADSSSPAPPTSFSLTETPLWLLLLTLRTHLLLRRVEL